MSNYSKETIAGIFVFIGIICLAYLTIKLGKMELIGSDGYNLTARFGNISGLKTGADVEIAGVRVGKVSKIELDQKRDMALVYLQINKDVKLSDDVFASVKTSGLIGDKYIQLTPGSSSATLENGEEITETESAVDIESLISKYVFGKV